MHLKVGNSLRELRDGLPAVRSAVPKVSLAEQVTYLELQEYSSTGAVGSLIQNVVESAGKLKPDVANHSSLTANRWPGLTLSFATTFPVAGKVTSTR